MSKNKLLITLYIITIISLIFLTFGNEYYQTTVTKRIVATTIAVVLASMLLLLIFLLHTYTKLKKNNQQLFKKYNQVAEIYNTYYAQREWYRERIKELERKVEEMNHQLYGESPSKIKYEHSTLEEENKQRLLNKILEVMYNNKEIYSHEFSLQRLSELVGAPYKHVSQVINEMYKFNFNNLLNEFRVREACRRLAEDDNYTNYTIEAIAESIGFKSRSNFISTFKKLTGITPSEYKRIATKQQ